MRLKEISILNLFEQIKENTMSGLAFSAQLGRGFHTRPLIYSMNMIIKYGIWQPVKFQLVSRFCTGSKMKWFLSYLWIHVDNINSKIW